MLNSKVLCCKEVMKSGPRTTPGFPNISCFIFVHRPESQNHGITESQNSRGWKGPLWVI